MSPFVTANREEILRIAARHGVTAMRVFGSCAAGTATDTSDVDLLVSVGHDPSPWFPGGLVHDLEQLLGRRVDVVTERGLRPELREVVIANSVPL